MPVALSSAGRKVENVPALREVERVTVSGRVLAVAQRADSTLVLCREVLRAPTLKGDDGEPRKGDDGATLKGEPVPVLKVTGDLADFADALAAKLIA